LAIVLGADVCWWSLSNTLTECCGTFSVRCTTHMTYYQHHGLLTLSSLLSHDLTLLQSHELNTMATSHDFIITMVTRLYHYYSHMNWKLCSHQILHHRYGHVNSTLWSHNFIMTMLTRLYHYYSHMNSTLWSHDLNI
jgi:hypothetical protein